MLFKKIGRLLKQKSTWVGAGVLAVAVGAPQEVGLVLDDLGSIAGVIFGTGLMAFDTARD